jgi:hypothetical protein
MADELPDAPWATGAGGAGGAGAADLPDAPWVTPGSASAAIGAQHEAARAAMEERAPQSLEETKFGFIGQAQEKIKRAVAALRGETHEAPEPISPGVTRGEWTPGRGLAVRPYGAPAPGTPQSGIRQTAGNLGDIASGGIEQFTAAPKAYLGVPIERATGVPVETQSELVGAAAALAPGIGGIAREGAAARAAARPLEGDILPPQGGPTPPGGWPRGTGSWGTTIEGEATPPSAPRLLPPNIPHSARSSVGAATTSTDPLAGYSPDAIASARRAINEAGVNPHDIDELSPHHFLAEVNPALRQEAGKLYAADQGLARNTLWQSVTQRAAEVRDRLRETFNRNIGPEQNTAQWQRNLEQERARRSEPAWQQYASSTVPVTPALDALIPRMNATGALRAADRAMTVEGMPADGMFGKYEGEPNTQPSPVAWQFAKEHLDHLIAKEMEEGGNMNEARRLTRLKNDLVSAIDNHPADDVRGLWVTARRLWQEPSELIDSMKTGRRVLTRNVDADDLPYLTQGWSQQRMEAAGVGIRKYLEDLLQGNRRDVAATNRTLDAVLSPGNQDKLRFFLGDRNATEVIDALRHEEHMSGARDSIIGGSPTAGRMLNNSWVPQPSAISENLSRVGAAIRHPLRSAMAEGVEAVQGRVSAAEQARMAGVRDEVARMFTTQGTERDALLRRLLGAPEPAPGWSAPPPGGTPGPGPAPAPTGGGPGAPPSPTGPAPAPQPAPRPAPRAPVPPVTPRPTPAPGADATLDDIRAAMARAESTPPSHPPAAPSEAPAPSHAARGTLDDIRATLERLDKDATEHLAQTGAPHSTALHARIVELTNEGLTPHEAHQRAVWELSHEGKPEGLPPIPTEARRNIPDIGERTPGVRPQAGADEGQPGRPGTGETSPVSGEGRAGEGERAPSPRRRAIEQVAGESALDDMAARLRRAVAETGGLSGYVAQREAMAAEARAAAEAKATQRQQVQAKAVGRTPRAQEPPRPEWASQGRELTPEEDRTLQEQLRKEWENRPAAEPVAREALKGVPRSRRNEPMAREVEERGRSGRPVQSSALQTGIENRILEEGLSRSKAERFNWPIRTIYGKTIDMPITVNPSKSMILRELAQHGDVRALRAPNGDVYLWPANEAMHVDIADNFDLPFKTRQELQKNSYLFNKRDVDALQGFSNFDDLMKKLDAAGSSEPLKRNVIERGRSRRPNETEPLPIGKEEEILERGYEKRLRDLAEQGKTAAEIAKEFGVSRNTVAGKLYRLGVSTGNNVGVERSGMIYGRSIDELRRERESGKSFYRIAQEWGKGVNRAALAQAIDRYGMSDAEAASRSPSKSEPRGREKVEKRTPKLSDWEIGPDGTMVRTLRKRGGAVDKLPMITRKQSNYAPDRGKPNHHCGPDKQWPHGFCAMFRGPHKCTEVAGFIATKGGCDWYERAEIRRAEGGPVAESDPLDYTDKYNTVLPPHQEQQFQDWIVSQSKATGRDLSKDLYNYDMRGDWLAGANRDERGHGTDIFKKPNHMTFSTGSKYHGAEGNEGGQWTTLPNGSWTFAPGKTNLKNFSPEDMQDYFTRVEPGNRLIMPEQRADGGPTFNERFHGNTGPTFNERFHGDFQTRAERSAPPSENVDDRTSGGPSKARLKSMLFPEDREPPRRTKMSVDTGVDDFASGGRVNHEPTEAQKEAGNYQKRHVKIHGLDISIENEKGSTRSGIGKDGKPWSVKLPYVYGYIRRTEGADGDHVDVMIGPHLKSDKVFIVDQHDAETRRFDEHKCFVGFGSIAQVRAHYLRGFSDGKGKHRLRHITEMTVPQFKEWLKGDMTKPAAMAA